jgi:hypothetical protein
MNYSKYSKIQQDIENVVGIGRQIIHTVSRVRRLLVIHRNRLNVSRLLSLPSFKNELQENYGLLNSRYIIVCIL